MDGTRGNYSREKEGLAAVLLVSLLPVLQAEEDRAPLAAPETQTLVGAPLLGGDGHEAPVGPTHADLHEDCETGDGAGDVPEKDGE